MPKQQALFAGLGDHLLGFGDLVADRLFAQHVAAGFERLHGGLVVVAAVLIAAGGDADQVGLQGGQHLRGRRRRRARPARRGVIGAVFLDIADADQFGQRVLFVDHGMAVADRPHADHADPDFAS